MKKIILTLIVTCFFVSARATNEFFTTYAHDRVHLVLCYNYSYVPLPKMLAYKAYASILNDYAVQKVREGSLDPEKIISIHIGGVEFGGRPSVELTRSRQLYYASLHEWPDLRRLMQLIDYFASPDWESLVYSRQEQYEAARNLLDRRLERYAPDPDMSFATKDVVVYSEGDIRIIYREGELVVYGDGTIISDYGSDGNISKLGNVYPVKMKDRHIVFYDNRIEVWQVQKNIVELEEVSGGDALIMKRDTLHLSVGVLNYPIPANANYEDWHHDYFAEVYDDWMNVYFNNRRYPVFSYCYSRNRIYTIR